jgi:phosphohistidine swiveling domain-containing protein
LTDPLTLVLRGEGVEPLVAGGKGAALDRLVALDARVPRTGVVTTSSYRAFEAQPEIASFVAGLKASEVPDPSEHDTQRLRVDEAFLSVALPADVAREVDALADEIGGGAKVAVRSSATAEDLASASFAGQYESYLNVDRDGVHDALRLVWASLWYPAPRAYRRFRDIDEVDLTMAVVVMRMLDPTHAGVLFTVDPGGTADAVRLEVVEGLGEQLVSGERTPDAHVIARAGIVDAFAAISAPLADLAREAVRLEEALGGPQDIEFAVHDDELYLVQARPITTTVDEVRTDDGFDFSCGHETTYTTAGIAEMLPGVLLPLSWGINSWLVENGFRYLFDLLGGGADVLTHGNALIGRFRGRAALNLDAMRAAAGSIPGGSPEELEQQYFGEALPSAEINRCCDEATDRSGKSNPLQGVKVLKARRKAAEESEIVIQAVDRVVENEPDLAKLSDDDLLAYWNRILHLAQRVVAVEVAVAAMASAAYRSVELFLSRYLDAATASQAVQELTSTDATDHRSRVALALEDVISHIAADDTLRVAAVEDWCEAREQLEATERGPAVLDEFTRALARAGSTGVFAGPTWDEVPNLAWMTVYQELTDPSETGASRHRQEKRIELERVLVRDPRWRWSRFVTGQLMDVRRKFLNREAADAAEFLQRREHTKAAVLILGGVVRRANVEIGRRLVEKGRLEAVEDVELVAVGEIEMLVGGDGPTLETLAIRRRRSIEAEQSGALPLVWTGEPPETTPADIHGERFEGWSASPGRYEGPARVVDSPATSHLRRGDVLVATTTDASWAPLFTAAGAVIVEQGGPLSHAAIVARELGMPAVANVPGLIARLRAEEGQAHLVVDGTAGVVTIQTGLPDDPEPRPDPLVTAGWAPRRQPSPHWDDTGMRFNVFVAGLMGAGALMSVLVGLTESISSTRGRERLRRKAFPAAAMMADGAVHGYTSVASSPTGLRPRRHYAIGSNAYFNEGGSPGGWGLSLSSAFTLLLAASFAAVATVRWPAVPHLVRRLAPGYPARQRSVWTTLTPPAQRAVMVMLTLVAIGAVLVIFAESWVLAIDEPLYFDWLEAGEHVDRWFPRWLILLGQPLPSILIAVGVSLMTLRCRVVALAYPLAVVGGGLINVTLSWITHRLRPPNSISAGEFTSYPGGHSLQLPLLLLILPLAVHVITNRAWARNVTWVLALAVWAMAWVDTVRTGGHWPMDQLAGLLIAASLLTVVYSVGTDARAHESCDGRVTTAD